MAGGPAARSPQKPSRRAEYELARRGFLNPSTSSEVQRAPAKAQVTKAPAPKEPDAAAALQSAVSRRRVVDGRSTPTATSASTNSRASRGALPKAPIGAGGSGFSQFERTTSLYADQEQEIRQDQDTLRDLMGDTGLSDNSSLDGVLPESLLELAKKSYAARPADIPGPYAGEREDFDTTGGGYAPGASDEAERMRTIQQDQMMASRNFLGEATSSGTTFQAQQPGREGMQMSNRARTQNQDETDEADPQQNDQAEQNIANQFMQQQLIGQRQQLEDEMRQQIQEAIKNAIQKAVKKAAQKAAQSAIRIGVESAEAIAGPEDLGLTWATLWAEMNIQLVSKYVLKNFLKAGTAVASNAASTIGGDSSAGENAAQIINAIGNSVNDIIPVQSFVEDFLTILLNILVVILLVMALMGFIVAFFGPLLVATGLGYLGVTTITDLFK